MLLLTPSGEIKTLWQDCPVYKIVSNEHFVFFIRGVEREFGFMRIESIRKNFAKMNKGTALFNPLGQISKIYSATFNTAHTYGPGHNMKFLKSVQSKPKLPHICHWKIPGQIWCRCWCRKTSQSFCFHSS